MTEEESRKEKIIEQNYFQEKTRFEIIEEKVKKTLFSVLNILLKFEDDDFSDEVIDLLNETCHFLFMIFMNQWVTYGKMILGTILFQHFFHTFKQPYFLIIQNYIQYFFTF